MRIFCCSARVEAVIVPSHAPPQSCVFPYFSVSISVQEGEFPHIEFESLAARDGVQTSDMTPAQLAAWQQGCVMDMLETVLPWHRRRTLVHARVRVRAKAAAAVAGPASTVARCHEYQEK